MGTYQEQFGRVERYLDRLEQSNRHEQIHLAPERMLDYEDTLWSFFQNAWHLKDWIKNDPAAPVALRQNIEQRCDGTHVLRLCADLANRTKHLELRRYIREDAKAVGKIMIRLTDSFVNGESTEQVIYSYEVIDQHQKTLDALQLARDIVKEWRQLITDSGGIV